MYKNDVPSVPNVPTQVKSTLTGHDLWYVCTNQNVPSVPQNTKKGVKWVKTLIGIPCMDKLDTQFFASVLKMKRVGDIHFDIKKGSMIYDARNEIAVDAITQETDRVLMIDSDMRFDSDMMERMSARIDQGCEMVCGIFFKRVIPTAPVIYKQLIPPAKSDNGKLIPNVVIYEDYPKDALFEVEGCGVGAVMMTTELIKAVWDAWQQPSFMPLPWCGEDMAFCYKARMLGRKIWCDSSIKVGHLGQVEFNERTYLSQQAESKQEIKNENG